MPEETAVIEAPATQTPSAPSGDRPISKLMEAAAADGYAPAEIASKIEAQKASAPDKAAEQKQEAKKPDADASKETASKKPWENLDAPAKKEAAKKEAPAADEEELTPPKGLDEKGGARWKELKQAEKRLPTLEAENAALKKQIADGETGKSEMTLKELESLRKEKAEIEQLVAEKKLERSEDFKNTVLKPIETANSQIAKLVELSRIDSVAMQKAVGISDEMERIDAIGKILEGLESPLRPMQEAALYKAVENIHTAWAKEDELRASARDIETAADARQSASAAQAEKAKAEEWTKASDAMFETLANKLPILKDPDVARQVRDNSVKSDDVTDLAYRAQAGALFPHIVRENHALSAKVAELESVIADYNGSKPSTDTRQEQIDRGGAEFKGLSPSQAALKAGYA